MHPEIIRTGDKAIYFHPWNPISVAIAAFTPEWHEGFARWISASHVAEIVRKKDGQLYKREMTLPWYYHQAFTESRFTLDDPNLIMVVRFIDSIFRSAEDRRRATLSAVHESEVLLKIGTPYDVGEIVDFGLQRLLLPFNRLIGKFRPILDTKRRYVCSTLISELWDPQRLKQYLILDDPMRETLFHKDPKWNKERITPAMVACSPFVRPILFRQKGRLEYVEEEALSEAPDVLV